MELIKDKAAVLCIHCDKATRTTPCEHCNQDALGTPDQRLAADSRREEVKQIIRLLGSGMRLRIPHDRSLSPQAVEGLARHSQLDIRIPVTVSWEGAEAA